jgi:hypothetical protein
MSYDTATLEIGDIVKAKIDSIYFEGVIVAILNDEHVSVDFGDSVEYVKRVNCYIILRSADLEIGDIVETISQDNGKEPYQAQVYTFNANRTINVRRIDEHSKTNNSDHHECFRGECDQAADSSTIVFDPNQP